MGPEYLPALAGARLFQREMMAGHDLNHGLPATNYGAPSQEGETSEIPTLRLVLKHIIQSTEERDA